MQPQLIAGDTLNFSTAVDGYSPADGWTLKYRLVPVLATGTVVLLQAAAQGQAFVVQTPASTTAGWPAGVYSWTSWVDRAGEVYSVASGQITILPDPRQVAAGYDSRSVAVRALDACEAAMATFNSTGGKVKKYEIAGRTMEFQSIAELMQLHSFWKARVATEQTASSIAQGLGNPRNLFVRFSRS